MHSAAHLDMLQAILLSVLLASACSPLAGTFSTRTARSSSLSFFLGSSPSSRGNLSTTRGFSCSTTWRSQVGPTVDPTCSVHGFGLVNRGPGALLRWGCIGIAPFRILSSLRVCPKFYNCWRLTNSFLVATCGGPTALPTFIFGVFEQDLSREDLLKHPAMYRMFARNKMLSLQRFGMWVGYAIFHAAFL